MIIAYLISGLGNQMFQYATARALSLRLGTDLFLDLEFYQQNPDRPYQLDHFKIFHISEEKFSNFTIDVSMFQETSFQIFQPEVLSLNDNTLLVGYWQFEKYFSDQAEQIRREFVLKDPISEASRIWARKIFNDPQPVSLHIRRTDYITGWGAQNIYPLPLNYYIRCIRILRENFPDLSLYIFSDDLDWCRRNLNFGVPTYFVDANDESRGYEDMFLMSLCRHHIIANSSFSWWGAWLDNRIGSLTFAPRRYYQYFDPVGESSRFPANWIVLDE